MYFFIGKEAPKFTFQLLGSNQRTRTIYTGIGVARELDACSDVPALDEHLSHQALASKIQQKLQYKKWQRALKYDRVNNIGEFWANPNVTNQICNSIVLAKSQVQNCIIGLDFADGEGNEPILKNIETHTWYAHMCPGGANGHPTAQSLSDLLEEFGRVNPGQADNEKPCDATYVLDFLQTKVAEDAEYKLWSDHCPDIRCDYHAKPIPVEGGKYRPFEIVDGQHRTRGVNSVQNAQFENEPADQYGHCSNDETAHHTDPALCQDPFQCGPGAWSEGIRPTQDFLPFTLLPWDDDQAKARVFTDITTRGRDMQPLHKLSMLWRFSLPDGKITQWGEDKTWNFEDDSEHTLAYILCIALAKNTLNQTKGKIPPIITKDHNTLIGVESLFNDYILKWMKPGKILDKESVYTSDALTNSIATQINHYLNAWAYWLSGPMDGPGAPATNQRVWTPSHELWTTAPGAAAQHPHFAAATAANAADPTIPDYMNAHKSHRGTGGYFQTPTNPTPAKDMQEGKVAVTGLMWLVFDLLPLVVESILKDSHEQIAANAAIPWDPDFVTNANNITTLTFTDYRDKLEDLLKQYPFNAQNRVAFGTTPMRKEQFVKSGERRDIINRIKKDWGWP